MNARKGGCDLLPAALTVGAPLVMLKRNESRRERLAQTGQQAVGADTCSGFGREWRPTGDEHEGVAHRRDRRMAGQRGALAGSPNLDVPVEHF